jgi:hypothetical protein
VLGVGPLVGCICRLGCFGGLGGSACLEVLGTRLDMLSVRFRGGRDGGTP